ncbi:hypothetical protein BDZ88DRAFT_432713 [Geranomyces variabilis]|nr:hypothetical protein BDZ88DRAFT_432713 [Geranomyces variabilis]KAJ3140143.1 hypothetical protein HDU90_008367 [Geranomyces variabilis]
MTATTTTRRPRGLALCILFAVLVFAIVVSPALAAPIAVPTSRAAIAKRPVVPIGNSTRTAASTVGAQKPTPTHAPTHNTAGVSLSRPTTTARESPTPTTAPSNGFLPIVSQIIDIPPGPPGPILSLPGILGAIGLAKRQQEVQAELPVPVATTGGDDQIPASQLVVNEVLPPAPPPPPSESEASVALIPSNKTGGDDSIAAFAG